jgi:hypothetical protein
MALNKVAEDNCNLAKNFMKTNFYSTALQIAALRLGELCSGEADVVDVELGKAVG